MDNEERYNAAAGVYLAIGWLTTRDETIKMGASENACPAAKAAEEICKEHGLGEPAGSEWPKGGES